MDSARFALAIVLMIAVIVITNLLFPPAARQRAVKRDTAHVTAPAAPGGPPATTSPASTTSTPAAPATAAPAASAPALTAAPVTVVESPLYRFAVSNAGA